MCSSDLGEVDCVVAVGTLAADVERAIAALGDSLAVVRVDAETEAIRSLVADVQAAGGRA